MIVQPKIRGYICTTAHPVGCAEHVREQIEAVKQHPAWSYRPQKVLVIGASHGYGLSSRIAAAFGCGAATLGVIFEKLAEGRRTATAGLYNTGAFEEQARAAGLYARSFNRDAFSDETKARVIEAIKNDWGSVDLVIYSLAAPRRLNPKTGRLAKSTLKPIGRPYTGKSIDFATREVIEVTLPPASDEEIAQTIEVMGGEDWELWIHALREAGLLSDSFRTMTYSYVGPEITRPIYREGTIGRAKDHLEATARRLDEELRPLGGRAWVSVNKALVTQSSSAIPFIPLYYVLLAKVMKAKGIHENSIQQIMRLFSDFLSQGESIQTDEEQRIRLDDRETREDVQAEVLESWQRVTTENLPELADLEGYQEDFLKLFGFGFPQVDYAADVPIDQFNAIAA